MPSIKLYNSASKLRKNAAKLNYFSSSVWRHVLLTNINGPMPPKARYVFSKSSVVPSSFQGLNLNIHNGRRLTRTRYITRWMIGFKFGNFSVSRKIAKFKAKQLRKKKKKKIMFEHILQIY